MLPTIRPRTLRCTQRRLNTKQRSSRSHPLQPASLPSLCKSQRSIPTASHIAIISSAGSFRLPDIERDIASTDIPVFEEIKVYVTPLPSMISLILCAADKAVTSLSANRRIYFEYTPRYAECQETFAIFFYKMQKNLLTHESRQRMIALRRR